MSKRSGPQVENYCFIASPGLEAMIRSLKRGRDWKAVLYTLSGESTSPSSGFISNETHSLSDAHSSERANSMLRDDTQRQISCRDYGLPPT